MPGLLADVNVEGQLAALVTFFESAPWAETWAAMAVTVHRFSSLELSPRIVDLDLWQTCQRQELVLVTGNRNMDDEGSLESTIRRLDTPQSLPVLTLADPERIIKDRSYAERVAVRLLEYLVDIDDYRGAGRLFLP